MKQGLVNICRNIWFSLASTAIISACIFLFCVFFSVITNIEYMVRTAETTMGITVFFDENLTEDEIKDIMKITLDAINVSQAAHLDLGPDDEEEDQN